MATAVSAPGRSRPRSERAGAEAGTSRGSTASTFTGNLTGTNLSGQTFGGFFGPSGQETGGSFAVKNVSGSTYIASGIFAGKQ